jgi:diguanylate cyclase (GGDEF)-like protein
MVEPRPWDDLRSRLAREHILLASLAVLYFVTGRAGLALSYGHPAVSLVWPPAGLALGAFLLLGYRVWPVVFGAAFILYAATLGPVPATVMMAAGNTCEGVLAAYLVNRYAGGRHALQNPRNSLRFTGVVLLTTATVSATIPALSLSLSGLAYWTDYGSLWLTMSLGGLVSMLLISPAIILYSQGANRVVKPALAVEGAVALVAVLAIGVLVFYRAPLELRMFPHELLCLPVLLWVAFRLGRRAAVAAMLILATFAIVGTLNGYGPFVRPTAFNSLLIVQLFMALTAMMTLSLSALASEFSIAEAQLRELVVTDPLTGLPNYRRLLEVLTQEIARADRHGTPIAVVFFDMDGLKDINDVHGHLIGSRAVCRFAETLKAACRATDTAARYGGDEFVAVLSETNQEGARHVIRRITERLAEDSDGPALSVSAGVAVYPGDGGTPTTLLSAADRALYVSKAGRVHVRRRNVVGIREWTSAGSR